MALKASTTNHASSSHGPQASTSRQIIKGPSATHEASAQPSKPLFRSADLSSDDDSVTSDSGSARSAKRAAKAKEKAARRHSDSTWGMQRPQEQQQHTKDVANASVSPQKNDKGIRPKPRQSAPAASTSASIVRPAYVDGVHRGNGPAGQSSDDEEDLLRAIRQSLSTVPASQSQQQEEDLLPPLPIRKQPAPPPTAALREVAADHGLEYGYNNDASERAYHMNEESNNMAVDELGDAEPAASNVQNGQEEYGYEIPIDQIASQAGPSRLQVESDADDFDLDMTAVRRSASVKSHHRTSSGGGSARKEMPDQFFDGYKATRARGRSARPGPPGMDEASVCPLSM